MQRVYYVYAPFCSVVSRCRHRSSLVRFGSAWLRDPRTVLKLNQTWWPAFRSRAAATRALWAIVAVVSAIVDERENHNFPCSTICQGLLLSFYPPPFFYLAFFRFSFSFFFFVNAVSGEICLQ